MTAGYAANQTSALPQDLAAGDYVFDHERWVPVDHVEIEGGVAVIHLEPIRCAVNEPIQVCKAG